MRNLAICLIVAALPLVATAQEFAPGEHVLVPIPEGFEEGYSVSDGATSLQEYVPEGQTVTAWTDMLSVRMMRDFAGTDPEVFHALMRQILFNDCPGAVAAPVTDGIEEGTAFHLLFVQCPDSPITGGPETFLSKAMGGQDALYLVQAAWRGGDDEDRISFWAAHLATVRVCDTRRADAPCPN